MGHDNSGMGASWHLEHVEVYDSTTGVVRACGREGGREGGCGGGGMEAGRRGAGGGGNEVRREVGVHFPGSVMRLAVEQQCAQHAVSSRQGWQAGVAPGVWVLANSPAVPVSLPPCRRPGTSSATPG